MHTFAQKMTAGQQNKSAKSMTHGWGPLEQSHSVGSILHLQHAIGNQAVQRLLQNNPDENQAPSSTDITYYGQNFSRIPVYPERSKRSSPKFLPILDNIVGNDEKEGNLLNSSLQTSGRKLPVDVMEQFESRFGHDFSEVRIHADEKTQKAALLLQARAFTAGHHIGFGPYQYRPHSSEGQRLLAHELTHVAQQTGAPSHSGTQHSLEQGAAAAAQAVSGEGPIEASGGSATFGRLQFDRGPDLVRSGLHTFYLGANRVARVMAIQIGVQPNAQRVSLQVAALPAGLRNPPLAERSMLLAISPTAPLAPRIIGENEVELPEGDVFQKTVEIQLNADQATPIVSVVMHYGRPRQAVPFPEGGLGVWRPMSVETGWIGINDGLRQLAVNFPTQIAGSLWSAEWRPYVHPGLGDGFINTRTNRFQPYPLGRPNLRAPEEAIRTYIHFIPIVGSLVMAGEALVGQSIWGRPLSTTERALLGAGAVLAEIGPIMRVGAAAARTSAAVNRLTTVTQLGRLQALRLVIGSRYLTEPEMVTLQRLAREVRAGRALSEANQAIVGRLMGKLNEGARATALRAEVATTSGVSHQPGRFTDLGTRTSADETRVGQALARDLNADVVRAAESAETGVRTGDYLLDDLFAEAYSPRTGNLENLLRQATSKHQQAGTLVIDLTHTPLSQSAVVGSANRIFGRPEASDLYRIIYVKEGGVVADVLRSAAAPGSQLPGVFIRGAASTAAQESR